MVDLVQPVAHYTNKHLQHTLHVDSFYSPKSQAIAEKELTRRLVCGENKMIHGSADAEEY